jgi:hypothetical protein
MSPKNPVVKRFEVPKPSNYIKHHQTHLTDDGFEEPHFLH